mmetsp:Transcript_22177/g.49902  ORF Transcript_22177/g.49902 Transcript_22177/m.49902 type:complete len:300 (-) Transcript_22177:60-959(-)
MHVARSVECSQLYLLKALVTIGHRLFFSLPQFIDFVSFFRSAHGTLHRRRRNVFAPMGPATNSGEPSVGTARQMELLYLVTTKYSGRAEYCRRVMSTPPAVICNSDSAILDDIERVNYRRNMQGTERDPEADESWLSLRAQAFVHFVACCEELEAACSNLLLYNTFFFSYPGMFQIVQRMGALHCYDAMQVGFELSNTLGKRFSLDLSFHEDRQIALFLILLGAIEEGDNLVGCNYSEANIFGGTNISFIVPGTWLTKIPNIGIFSGTYQVEKPEHELPDTRRKLANRFMGWFASEFSN